MFILQDMKSLPLNAPVFGSQRVNWHVITDGNVCNNIGISSDESTFMQTR